MDIVEEEEMVAKDEVKESIGVLRSTKEFKSLDYSQISSGSSLFSQGAEVERCKGDKLLPLKKRIVSTYKSEEEEAEEAKALVLPPKKRKRVYAIKFEDQKEEKKEQYEDEKALPLKKRKSVYSFNWEDFEKEKKEHQIEGEEVIEKEREEMNRMIEEDNIEDKAEGEEIIEGNQVEEEDIVEMYHMIEKEEDLKSQELGQENHIIEEKDDKEDMGTQVSNPITLIAIAASWLTDAEALIEKGNHELEATTEIKPIPQAYALIDASEESDAEVVKGDEDEKKMPTVELEKETTEDNVKGGSGSSCEVVIAAQYELKEPMIIESKERKYCFTKPRSRVARRPKATYTSLTDANISLGFNDNFGVVSEGGEEQQQQQVLEEEEDDDKEDDLYSKVKKRSGRIARGSRCTRVNGKGWRCAQPTRIGYSLCDHHLGREERLKHTSTIGSNVWKSYKEDEEELMKRGRKKGENKKKKTRSLKIILAQTVPICKW